MSDKLTVELPYNKNIDEYIKQNHPQLVVVSKSLDARNAVKGRIPKYIYQLDKPSLPETFKDLSLKKYKPIIVGMGPSGLFAALRFLEFGVRPTILEQGKNIKERSKDVAVFFTKGILNETSNIYFGQGGAGLFSDGKLNTRIKSNHINYFKRKLVEFGAPPSICYETSSHLGTDSMRKVVSNMCDFLNKYADVHLECQISELLTNGNDVVGITSNKGETYGDCVILAIGQMSPLWNYLFLNEKISFGFKEFAVGFRIEHDSSLINKSQYGDFAKVLPPASYKLRYHNDNAGVYSFCMCPGGVIVNSSSRQGELVINGMSSAKRDGKFSSSGIIRTIREKELEGNSFLKGLNFIQDIEKKSYLANNLVPGQKLDDFIEGRVRDLGSHSVVTGATAYDLNTVYPKFIIDDLKLGLLDFCKKIKNFNKGQLFAPETRTSSPFKVINTDLLNLYFVGEGSGFAGGITSSAVNGIEQADAILNKVFG